MSRLAKSPNTHTAIDASELSAFTMMNLVSTDTPGADSATNAPGDVAPVLATRQVNTGDDYLAKVAKYIPGEIVAAYLAAQTLITNLAQTVPGKTFAFLAMVLILAVLNPFYLKRLAARESTPQEQKPWKRQAIVSTLSFLVWVYALVEAPNALGIYNALFASLLLIVWTLLAGLVVPEDSPT